ncbi:MAG: pilus assembly protein TadG-related protein, partial [Erythrobacter sp.]|nr:pilus assembly protein TadG-related protein [Erythrobacter sp.]MDZ4274841.1 pilus assembly protein TadG-related protein [Erythrobacter sp.]
MIAKRLFIDFAKARDAAIAPLYALALFGLIMIAGVGWDYSRMATMHSELQNAADQAALAAATQLTGVSGA